MMSSRYAVTIQLLLYFNIVSAAFGQSPGGILNLFGNMISMPGRESTRLAWSKMPGPVVACIEARRGPVRALVEKGVRPESAELLSDLDACRTVWQSTLKSSKQNKSLFSVGGLRLGEIIDTGNPVYKRYKCEPSEYFDGLISCARSTDEHGATGRFESTYSILHTQSNSTVYVSRLIKPAYFKKAEITLELSRLSDIFGLDPQILSLSGRPGQRDATIASWGKLKLEALNENERSGLASGNPRSEILVDFLNDLQNSLSQGLSVYRISGGPGFVWIASFDPEGKGTLRTLAIDPSVFPDNVNPQLANKLAAIGSSTGGDGAPKPPYLTVLFGLIMRQMLVPPDLQSGLSRFDGVVAFDIGENGDLRKQAVQRASGRPDFDTAALDAVKRAAPFPPPPPGSPHSIWFHYDNETNDEEKRRIDGATTEARPPTNQKNGQINQRPSQEAELAANAERQAKSEDDQKKEELEKRQARLGELSAEADRLGPAYARASGVAFKLFTDANTLEDKPERSAKSIQSNGSGAVVEITGRCAKPGLYAFTALLVDDDGKPTLGIPGVMLDGSLSIRRRINDDPISIATAFKADFANEFIVALFTNQEMLRQNLSAELKQKNADESESQNFENNLGQMQSLAGDLLLMSQSKLAFPIIWRVSVEFQTNKGNLVAKIPTYDEVVRSEMGSCLTTNSERE